jgi:hypothetical protein
LKAGVDANGVVNMISKAGLGPKSAITHFVKKLERRFSWEKRRSEKIGYPNPPLKAPHF